MSIAYIVKHKGSGTIKNKEADMAVANEVSKIRRRYQTEMTRGRKQHQMTTMRLQAEINKRHGKALMGAAMTGTAPEDSPAVQALLDVIKLVSSDDWLFIGELGIDAGEQFESNQIARSQKVA